VYLIIAQHDLLRVWEFGAIKRILLNANPVAN
jgi:hypothetical protein